MSNFFVGSCGWLETGLGFTLYCVKFYSLLAADINDSGAVK